ncbi:Rne/Rng family ribonuclease [Bacillus weihaiensis]|uniref:Rne/Rng family ribonuclease n=1 Tax=Bacillus weihaiensis TaxID=1547283 RepID=UPI002352B628|nr:Rne/Rng family ribonuclease [Bacillus weihaiensis]
MRKLFINEKTDEVRIAVMENNKLVGLYQSKGSDDEIIGNVYAARVKKVLPGMQAAFIDVGMEHNGYLHRNDVVTYQLSEEAEQKPSISHYVQEGQQLLVQVVKEGTAQKGPKLTTNIEYPGETLVYMPYGNYVAISKKIEDFNERKRLSELANELKEGSEGILFRTASVYKTNDELISEYNRLKNKFLALPVKKTKKPYCVQQARSFVEKIMMELAVKEGDTLLTDQIDRFKYLKNEFPQCTIQYHEKKEPIFSTYKIEQEIDKLTKQIVWLQNGAYIIIEQTEAMTIIDINTGKFSGKLSMRDTVLKTNQLAAVEIAKQIRLRNLSGIILIDFIDMKHKADQQAVLHTITTEMKKDHVQHKVIGFTELNILQLTRKKVRQTHLHHMTTPCKICNGTGRIISPESVAFKLERELWSYQYMEDEAIWIEATKDVSELVQGERLEHQAHLEETLKCTLYFTEVSHPVPTYHIKYVGSNDTIMKRINS